MTKHNLQRSLPWLLKHPHPVHENLDHIRLAAAPSSSTTDDGTIRTSQDMARLQLAPQTATKPRLLTQSKPSPGLPTPGPSRSLIEQRRQQQQQHSPTTSSRPTRAETPIKYTVQQQQTKTPASAYADSVFDDVLDIDDVERVDLTSGDPHSSSFGDFGTPELLWDEPSATRVRPLSEKRGKKRKSDEYRQDLASPAPRQGPPKRKADSVQAPSITLDLPEEWSDYEDEEKDEATQKAAQPEQLDLSSIRQKPQGSQSSKGKESTSNHLSSQPKHEFRDLVPDSDEEDLLQVFGEAEPKLTSRSPRIVKEDKPSSSQQLAPIEQGPEDTQSLSPSQVKATRQSTPADICFTQQNSALTHQTLLTPPAESDAPVPYRRTELPRDESTPSNPRRLTSADQAIVAKYMESGTEGIQSFLKRLEASKQETISTYAEIRIRGDTVPGWLKTKKETIAARIVAANKLLELHAQYAATLKEKESCKRRMVEMLSNDEDIEGPFAAHVDELAARCHAQEAAIFSQLHAAGLKDMSPPSTKAHTASTPSLEPLDPTGVLVASTQCVPPRSLQKSNQPTRIRSQDNSAGSTVRPALPYLEAHDDNDFSTERFRRHSPDKCYRTGQSPLKQSTPTSMRQTHAPEELSTKAFATNSAGAGMLEENCEEFFDDDDDDMLDVANAFERGHGPLHRNQHNATPRAALSELSDNVRRPPASQLSTISKPNAALMNNPVTKDAFSALRKRFHLEGFRPNQLEAVFETLSGRDAFVLMPTGGGKSLCYQLPAILDCGKTRGVTIVISPLLSLMQDQVDHLQKLKIQAMLINSEVSPEHKELVFEALRGPNPQRFIQLLYITPEMLTKSAKLGNALDDLFARQKLARIVIDEAHCVSQWGHDFRPDYKDIGNVRKRFNGVPAMALTATATENVKVDVMHNLGMTGCKVFTQSFNRPNLSYEVRPKVKGYLDDVAEMIKETYTGQSGIIYCLSRKDCERLAKKLSQQYSISATHYHALVPAQEKASIQKRWQCGEFQVIVATIAFGMGIDKPDVRFVIHNTIPKSLEGYYQETGRAGRDGQQSGCYLYYSYSDTHSIKRMIQEGEGSAEQKERQRQMLRNVVQFCENRSDCRRSQVLAYFNERFPSRQCGGCDNCNSSSIFQLEDFTQHARNAADLVRRVQKDNVTLLHCVDVYRGATGVTKIKSLGHNKLPEYGMGQELERGDCERLFQRLVNDDILEEHSKTNRAGWTVTYVHIGPNFNLVRTGTFRLQIQIRVSPKGKSLAKSSKATRKKALARNQGTGVRASVDDYPVSTNVSSPLQPRSRPPRNPMVVESDYDECDDDDYHEDHQDQEEHHLDYFEPIRTSSQPTRAPKRRSGPPIALDERIQGLDPSHRHILDIFIEQGRALVIKTMQDKDLRTRPVADAVLREIGINFPSTKDAMLKIRGMTEAKYNIVGPQLLSLVKNSRSDYEAILQAQGDMLAAKTSDAHVVEISDDDDYDFDEPDFPESCEDEDNSENSRYFSANGEVDADGPQTYKPRNKPALAKPKPAKGSFKKAPSRTSSGSFSRRGRGGSKGSTSARGPRNKFANSGVRKKSSGTSSRASGDRASVIRSYSMPKSGSGRGGSAGGISMMPT